MIAFRKLAGDAPVGYIATGQNNDAIAFGRGDQGFVLINRSQNTWTATLPTGLKGGTYTDVLGSAAGAISVDGGGKGSFTVPAMSAVAITAQSTVA
jgi:alpha-amylase